MQMLISLIIIYFIIGTIILLNILFNPNVDVSYYNKEKQELEALTTFKTICFCLGWIIIIPMMIIGGRFNINE